MNVMTDNNELDTNEIGAPDLELDGGTYMEAAAEENAKRKSGFVLPPPGPYIVQLPRTFSVQERDSRFNPGQRYLEVLLGDATEGLTIVGGTFDGTVIKYIRVTNEPRAIWDTVDGKRQKVGTSRFNDMHDVLAGLGVNPLPRTLEQTREAFASVAGAVSRYPWRFTWTGRATCNKNARGYAITLRGRDFKEKDENGQLLSYRTMVATHNGTIKIRKEEKLIAPGDEYRVYANLTLIEGGASPVK